MGLSARAAPYRLRSDGQQRAQADRAPGVLERRGQRFHRSLQATVTVRYA